MVLNICNFIQHTEQVPVELDISAIEEYILLLLLTDKENITNTINMQLKKKNITINLQLKRRTLQL